MARNNQQAAKPAAAQDVNTTSEPNVTAPVSSDSAPVVNQLNEDAIANEAAKVNPTVSKVPDADIPAHPAPPAVKKPHYQEWEVKIMNGKVEKLKVSREKVNISEDEANILNEGISKGGNTYAKMYFLSE